MLTTIRITSESCRNPAGTISYLISVLPDPFKALIKHFPNLPGWALLKLVERKYRLDGEDVLIDWS